MNYIWFKKGKKKGQNTNIFVSVLVLLSIAFMLEFAKLDVYRALCFKTHSKRFGGIVEVVNGSSSWHFKLIQLEPALYLLYFGSTAVLRLCRVTGAYGSQRTKSAPKQESVRVVTKRSGATHIQTNGTGRTIADYTALYCNRIKFRDVDTTAGTLIWYKNKRKINGHKTAVNSDCDCAAYSPCTLLLVFTL